MDRLHVSFDPEIFSRTATLFASKRSALATGAVEALASDIVQRLSGRKVSGPRFDAADISKDSIADFCDVLVQTKPEAALRFIEDRRAEGVTRHGVYLGYITGAARQLGASWDANHLSLAQVAIGTGHLYALMRALRAEDLPSTGAFDRRRYALFATVPGEDHGIGITIAADMFRDEGWEIDLQVGTNHDRLVARVENTEPQIIGLSLSTEQRLEALVRLVVAMRIMVPHAIIGVAPASDVDPKHLRNLVDIDLVFDDARSACRELDRLIAIRA